MATTFLEQDTMDGCINKAADWDRVCVLKGRYLAQQKF
jgi:hypothetical protein